MDVNELKDLLMTVISAQGIDINKPEGNEMLKQMI